MGTVWAVSLEVPRTEMVSLQVRWWLIWMEMLAAQTHDPYQSQALGETSGQDFSQIGVDLGVWGGMDLAWISWDMGKSSEKIRATFWNKIRAVFRENLCHQIKNPRQAPILVPYVLAHSGIVF